MNICYTKNHLFIGSKKKIFYVDLEEEICDKMDQNSLVNSINVSNEQIFSFELQESQDSMTKFRFKAFIDIGNDSCALVIHKKTHSTTLNASVWNLKFVRIDLVTSKIDLQNSDQDSHNNYETNSQDSYQVSKLGLKLKSLGLEKSMAEVGLLGNIHAQILPGVGVPRAIKDFKSIVRMDEDEKTYNMTCVLYEDQHVEFYYEFNLVDYSRDNPKWASKFEILLVTDMSVSFKHILLEMHMKPANGHANKKGCCGRGKTNKGLILDRACYKFNLSWKNRIGLSTML